jgi:hypothetical protein
VDIPRHNTELNFALELLDTRFSEAHDGPSKFSDAWDSLRPDELLFILDEVKKCMADRRYFLENYYVIKDEHGNLQCLYPWWDHQEMIYDVLDREWRANGQYKLIILKPRQCGGTAWAGGVTFHATIFTERAFTIQMAHDEDTSAEIYRRMWDAYNNLPWWMRPAMASKQQERHIIFQRADEKRRMQDPGLGSTLIISNAQKAAGVAIGKTIRCGHFSEVSRWVDADIWTADIEPSMNAKDTQAFMESTAFGRTGLFFNMWTAAEAGESDWTPIFIPVYRVRKYFIPIKVDEQFVLTKDELAIRKAVKKKENFTIRSGFFKWRRRKIRAAIAAKKSDELGTEAHQESYPLTPKEAFVSSGFCAFPRRKLNDMEIQHCRDPILIGEIEYIGPDQPPVLRLHPPAPEEVLKKPKFENRLWVWEEPDDNEAVEYYIGGDISSGDGRDFTNVPVYRIGYGSEPHVQVAEWHGLINPSHAARAIAALGQWYHHAEIAIEYAQAGITTCNELQWTLDYPNLYRWKRLDKIGNSLTLHTHWMTNAQTREDMINRMGEALLDRTVIIRNRHAIDEMRDFGRYEGEIKAAGIDNNDDMAVSHCICLCALHQSNKRQEWAESAGGGLGSAHSHLLPKTPFLYGVYTQFAQQVEQADTEAAANKILDEASKRNSIDLRKMGWSVRPIPVMRANTIWSPAWDSTGAEHELAKIHGMDPRQQMLSPDVVTAYRKQLQMQARFGVDTGGDSGGDYGDDDY